jgi:Tol biopolymer transport system component
MKAMVSICAAVAVLFALTAASADADVFGSIELLSSSPFEQAEYAHDPALSGDGRYVVFEGSVGGVSGIWRRENKPGGALQQVAGGDAELPSISEDGRFISFTTNEGARLSAITDDEPVASPEAYEPPNVYVRDMEAAPSQEGSFVLASAEDGSTNELVYEESVEERARGQYGSMAAPRSALSADGKRVAFVTTAPSDLAGPGTPALQVAVRDLETEETQLVSVSYDAATGAPVINPETGRPEPVSGRAVYTEGEAPPPFQKTAFYRLPYVAGASISADGSTVAWMGHELGQQIPTLAGEKLEGQGGAPLWRRIAGGESEPTREVTGGPDPENPGCRASPESHLPASESLADPCQGPFQGGLVYESSPGVSTDPVPQLSADGYTVAFLANDALVSQGEDYGTTHSATDLYVANMHAGLSRVQALRQLTEIASGDPEDYLADASILDLALSPDGEQVAFTTMRTVFPLGSLTYVSVPAAVAGLAEVFDVDLTNSTLTRVTHGYNGAATAHPYSETLAAGKPDPYITDFFAEDGALSPSFSDDGDQLAFSSTASNIVFGDGNTPTITSHFGNEVRSDGSDVFVVGRLEYPPEATAQIISATPAGPLLGTEWRLGVTAETLAGGRVKLYIVPPGPGAVRAFASSAVEVSSARASRSTRRARRSPSPRTKVAIRTVAVASRTTGSGMTELILTLAPTYRTLAARFGGLTANVLVTFSSRGHPALRESVQVSFLDGRAKKSSRKRRTAVRRTARR